MYKRQELGKSFFEERIDAMKERKGVKQDVELDANDLKELVKEFKQIYLEKQGEQFPQDPKEQLIGAVKAVFRSWDNPRANVYRKMNEIPYEWGTAVNVQQMAFGNSGMRSGTGVDVYKRQLLNRAASLFAPSACGSGTTARCGWGRTPSGSAPC